MTQWTNFVKQYAKENNLSYRESLKQAGQHYKLKKPSSIRKLNTAAENRIEINIIKEDKPLASPQLQPPSIVATHPNKDGETTQMPNIQPIIQQQRISNIPVSPAQQLKIQYNDQQDIFNSMMSQLNSNYKNKSRELMMSKLNLNRGDIKNQINKLRAAYELQKKQLNASHNIVTKTLLNKLNSISSTQSKIYIRV